MIPGFDSRQFNPKKMQGMMKQLGIEMNDLEDVEVVIIKKKNEDIIIKNPKISVMKAHESETYQISGTSMIIYRNNISNEDIDFVCQTTGVSSEKVKEILTKNNGDIAETINELIK